MRLFRIVVNILIIVASPLWILPAIMIFIGGNLSDTDADSQDIRDWFSGKRFMFWD